MPLDTSQHKADLEKLIALGDAMFDDLGYRILENKGKLDDQAMKRSNAIIGTFEREYQKWYTEAQALVAQLAPGRLDEFVQLYNGNGKRRSINSETYQIQDWLSGVRASTNILRMERDFNDLGIVYMRLQAQVTILKSLEGNFESSLFGLRRALQDELVAAEIAVARDMAKRGHLRPAGAIAGLLLERHLLRVVADHNIPPRKKDSTIADLNDLLKEHDLVDKAMWRDLQKFHDLRALCDHDKRRAPKPVDVKNLIDGVERITKSLA